MYSVEVRTKILQVSDKSVLFQVTCNFTVISTDGVDLTITINKARSPNQTLNHSLLCRENEPILVHFNDLQSHEKYFFFIQWTAQDICTLSGAVGSFETIAYGGPGINDDVYVLLVLLILEPL